METRTKYGFGSFKNLDQGEYEITEIKTKLQKYRHFAIIKPVTEPCHVQHRGIQSGKDTLFFQGIPFVETACRNQQPVI